MANSKVGHKFSGVVMASVLGIDPRTLDGWVSEGCPRESAAPGAGKSATYDSRAVWRWALHRELGKRERVGIDLAHEKARLARARADLEELRRREREADLLPRDQCAAAWSALVAAAEARIDKVAETFAERYPDAPSPLVAELRELLREGLDELARRDPLDLAAQGATATDEPDDLDD